MSVYTNLKIRLHDKEFGHRTQIESLQFWSYDTNFVARHKNRVSCEQTFKGTFVTVQPRKTFMLETSVGVIFRMRSNKAKKIIVSAALETFRINC
jgi:hypothetical protein